MYSINKLVLMTVTTVSMGSAVCAPNRALVVANLAPRGVAVPANQHNDEKEALNAFFNQAFKDPSIQKQLAEAVAGTYQMPAPHADIYKNAINSYNQTMENANLVQAIQNTKMAKETLKAIKFLNNPPPRKGFFEEVWDDTITIVKDGIKYVLPIGLATAILGSGTVCGLYLIGREIPLLSPIVYKAAWGVWPSEDVAQKIVKEALNTIVEKTTEETLRITAEPAAATVFNTMFEKILGY